MSAVDERVRVCATVLLALALIVAGSAVQAEPAAIDLKLAAQYFAEAKALSDRDGGALWGRPLGGPILFVEPVSRSVVGSEPGKEALLKKQGDAYVGTLPPDVLVANTAVEWSGTRWSMVMWPLPNDRFARANLLAHELWHRLQPELGYGAANGANDHLDSREGRLWLQLEWRALAAALLHTADQRREAVADALLFRARRHALFSGSADQERAMELHEGLAEYTGVRLSGAPDLPQYVIEHNLKEAVTKPTFVRSFAYATGPAYGLLLDQTESDWRKTLKPADDMTEMLRQRLLIELPTEIERDAEVAASKYDGASLAAAESRRDIEREKRFAAYRAKFIEGPVLVLPLQEMRMQFDPGELVPLEGRGTVYPSIKVIDRWGTLTVSGGALMESDFSKITVAAPPDCEKPPVKGDGWSLELNAPWHVEPAGRPGDYSLAK